MTRTATIFFPHTGEDAVPNGSTPQSIILLPCGDIATPGDPGEGAIEIKAAWRKLMPRRGQQRSVFHAERHLLHRLAREAAI